MQRSLLVTRERPLSAPARSAGAAVSPDGCFGAIVVAVHRLDTVALALGESAAREVAQEFGRRIRNWASEDDDVRDLGDGRFAVIVAALDRVVATARCAVLADLLATAVETTRGPVVRAAAIGVACDEERVTEPGVPELLMRADQALGWAAAGNEVVRIWDREDAERERLAAGLELRLQEALRTGSELFLHYQPEVGLRDGRLVAVEALVRWRHPELGMVGADMIVSIAEASGLIVALGRWALEQACAQRARWAARFPGTDFVVHVNVSPTQLHRDPGLPRYVGALLARHRLRGSQLGVELTEEVRTLDSPRAIASLAALRRLGVQIVIDDFGVAHSSPARLDDFPFDTVKIDGRFIHGPGARARTSETTRYVVSTLVHLAERVGMVVVAEGIETPGDIAELVALGCHRGQGNGLLAAVDAQRLEPVIAAGGIDLPTAGPRRAAV